MKILGIDTSGKIASVALCDENTCLAQTTVLTKLTHSQVILPMVEKVLKDSALTLDDVDYFAVADGPGSYTGLRIGISAVKGMCFTLNKKCIGISTLKSLAYNCIPSKSLIVSVMRARPEIAYFAAFESDGEKLQTIKEDCICSVEEIVKYLNFTQKDTILVGDYAKELYENYFSQSQNVRLSPMTMRMQNASSLCLAALADENYYTPDKLEVNYLQITKAEKDLKDKQN